jgi:glycosyltransferase involved in cell wall biosynthesis
MVWIEAARLVLREVPDAHFLIIGDGDMLEAVAAKAAADGFAERLHLPGRVADVGDWYRVMDVKLLTSEREGIPNAIIEAQHFGVAVVATEVGGIAEAIEEGRTGYTIPGPPGGAGPEPYAARLVEIFRDGEWRKAARQRAPEFVHDKFSLDKIVRQLLDYYGMPPTRP